MMNYNIINDSKKSSGFVVEKVRNGERVSSEDLHIGGRYVVIPENPKKLKHRDRNCTIIEFDKDKIDNPIRAKVRFADNNRSGFVELTDLVSNGQ